MSNTNTNINPQGTSTDLFATVGRWDAMSFLVSAICIALVLVVIGIYLLANPNSLASATGTITNAQCYYVSPGKYNCNLTVNYMVNNVSHTGTLNNITNSVPYTNGTTIEISYDTSNPTTINQYSGSATTMGIVAIVFAVCILCIAYWNYRFTYSSQSYAQYRGFFTLF